MGAVGAAAAVAAEEEEEEAAGGVVEEAAESATAAAWLERRFGAGRVGRLVLALALALALLHGALDPVRASVAHHHLWQSIDVKGC